MVDAASIGPILESEPEESALPREDHPEDERDEVFVNHGGFDQDVAESIGDDDEAPMSKSQAARETRADYGNDPYTIDAEAAALRSALENYERPQTEIATGT